MPGSDIGRGNILYDQILTINITPTSVATITTAEQTFTVKGLLPGDWVHASCDVAQTAGASISNARVSAPDTLVIQWTNPTAGPVTPPAGRYLLNVNRPYTPPLTNMA